MEKKLVQPISDFKRFNTAEDMKNVLVQDFFTYIFKMISHTTLEMQKTAFFHNQPAINEKL